MCQTVALTALERSRVSGAAVVELERRKVLENRGEYQNEKRQKAINGGLGDFKSNSNHMPHFQARSKGHCHADDGSATPGSLET